MIRHTDICELHDAVDHMRGETAGGEGRLVRVALIEFADQDRGVINSSLNVFAAAPPRPISRVVRRWMGEGRRERVRPVGKGPRHISPSIAGRGQLHLSINNSSTQSRA